MRKIFKKDHNGDPIAEAGLIVSFRIGRMTREAFTDEIISKVTERLDSETVDAMYAAYEQGYEIAVSFDAEVPYKG